MTKTWMACAVTMASLAVGCADVVEGSGRSVDQGAAVSREVARPGTPAPAPGSASACALYQPLFDEPIEGAETCAGGQDGDALYLARHLRSHVAQTSSFVGLGSVALHDVLLEAIAGRALESVGLGEWDRGIDYAFDAATGEYTITAKSGLVVGNETLGTWDAANAKGEIRLRLYWGTGPKTDQPLMADVFDGASYLVDPELDFDVLDQRLTVSYRSAGPLVGLLGWGDAPGNPAVVRVRDADRIRTNVSALLADAHVVVRIGQPDCAYTSLDFATPRRPLADWTSDPELTLDFVGGGTKRTYPAPDEVAIAEFGAKLSSQNDWLEGPVKIASGALEGELTLRRGDVTPAMRVHCR